MTDEMDRKIEEALRRRPPAAPPQMAARIMERVDRVERARERLAETSHARRGWLAAFASEPAAAVALALAPVFLVLWLAMPDTTVKLALLVRDSLAAWIAGASGGFLARVPIGPQGTSVLGVAATAALLAISFLALPWVAEPFRAIRPSGSSRKSPPPPPSR